MSEIQNHARPLDTLANRLSLTSQKEGKQIDWKDRRHALRHVSGNVIGGRTRKCGCAPIGGFVDVMERDAGGHHFNGLETCGSVWNCPVCAVKITEQRRTDVKAVLEAHLRQGGEAVMATVTIPHTRFQRVLELRKAVSTNWTKVQQGIGWKSMKNNAGFVGSIRALEVTHGANGWHPHLHVVILFKQGVNQKLIDRFSGLLFQRWARAIERSGFGTCSEEAFSVEPITDAEGVSKYCQKWGAAEELTKAHIKHGRSGGRSPWQILSDIAENNLPRDRALFAEYASAFKGSRQLTWTLGLRDRYLSEPELPDEKVAEELECSDVERNRALTIDRTVWKQISGRVLQGKLLTAMDQKGVDGVYEMLRRYEIPFAIGDRLG